MMRSFKFVENKIDMFQLIMAFSFWLNEKKKKRQHDTEEQ